MTRDQQRGQTQNGVQMCSLIHVARVVLCVFVLVDVICVMIVVLIAHVDVVQFS